MIPLILTDRKEIRGYQGLGGIRTGNYYLMGTEFGLMEKFWKLTVVVVARHCE